MVIGGVTLTGSLVAFGKLPGVMPAQSLTFSLQQPVHGLLVLAVVAAGALILLAPSLFPIILALLELTLLLGGYDPLARSGQCG
jgi:NAD(P) transhydrogenase subunit beta